MIETMRFPFECGICETPIRKIELGKLVKTDEYHEVDVKLNTLSFMTVGVCSKHKNPKKEDFIKMEHKAKLGWQEEVERGIGNKEWLHETGMNLKIVGVK